MIEQSVSNFTCSLIYSPAAKLMEEWLGRTWGQLIIQVYNSYVILCYDVPHVQHHNPFMTCSDPFQLFIYCRQIQNTWLCHGMVTILVHLAKFGCTSCSTPWPLHDLPWFLSPLIQKWITFFTQDIFKILCSVMVQWPFLCILVHFDAFWCIQCVTPWLVHDLLWLPSPFKCPLTPEMDYISHSGQIQNTLLCHAMETTLVHFGQFWCLLVHLMCNPITPPWLSLTPILFQVSI